MSIHDWMYLLLFTALLVGMIGIAEYIRRRLHGSPETTRKFVHMSVGVMVAFTPFVLESKWPMVILGSLFAVIDYIAVRKHLLTGMHGTSRLTYGTVFYPISFVILTLTLWQNYKIILVTGMLIMALSDAVAAIVGESVRNPQVLRYGPEKKTLQGSSAMFVTTLLITLATMSLAATLGYYQFSFGFILWTALTVAAVATASEVVSAKGSDNLSVPLFSAFTMYYFISEPVSESLIFTTGMLLALIVGLLSYRAKFLTGGGSVALFLLGTLVFGVGRWTFAIPILSFFILSSLLSKMGKKRKAILTTIFEKSDQRDAGQVLANGGVAGLMVVLWYLLDSNVFYGLYIAALAAVTADTWATEIGVMARQQPRSILNFKPVAMGTSGGITVLGTMGAALGSLILVVIGYVCSPHGSPRSLGITEAGIVLFAGVFAGMVDSFLGATVQAQFKCASCGKITEKHTHCDLPTAFHHGYSWINNDVVNGLCAVAGVAMAGLLFWLSN